MKASLITLLVLLLLFTFPLGCSNEPVLPSPTADAAPSPLNTPDPTVQPGSTNTPLPTVQPEPTSILSPTVIPSPIPATPATTPFPTRSSEPAVTPGNEFEARLDEIEKRAASVRGLEVLRPVEKHFITRDELSERLKKDLDEEITELENYQLLYETLGIIDAETDLYQIMLELYSASILGMYDPEEDKLFVVKDAAEIGLDEEATYVHEFVHALQQQHFDIQRGIDSLKFKSDEADAYRALFEGDATGAEIAYISQYLNLGKYLEEAREGGDSAQEAAAHVPHVIRRGLYFPYQEGFEYVNSLYMSGGWDKINQAYSNPPQSTEQVLHFGKYRDGEKPENVMLPDVYPSLGEGWTLRKEDSLGEFFWLSYLESYISDVEAEAASEGWGGDRYSLLSGSDNETVLIVICDWDSETDAAEFLNFIKEAYVVRTGTAWSASGSQAFTMMLQDRVVHLDITSDDTTLVIAPDSEVLKEVLGALTTKIDVSH